VLSYHPALSGTPPKTGGESNSLKVKEILNNQQGIFNVKVKNLIFTLWIAHFSVEYLSRFSGD